MIRRRPYRAGLFRPSRLPQKPLGDVEEYGRAQTVTLVVGQNKGHQAHNRAGRCQKAPEEFSVPAVDRAFLKLREAQVGRPNVGATRRTGRGWFEGSGEDSVAYEVAFIPNDREPTVGKFKANMDKLAESLACAFCQDSVLILRDTGTKKTAAGATCPLRKRARRG